MTEKNNTGSGSWTDPTTWTPAGVPSASDTVVLNYNGPATVTLSGTGNAASTEISPVQVLKLADGNLSGNIFIDGGGLLQASSGSDSIGGSVYVQDNGRLVVSNAVLRVGADSATIKNMGGISFSTPGGILVFGGAITFTSDLNPNSPNYSYVGGTVTLSDFASNDITTAGANTRGTITNVNNTIQGAGRLGDGRASVVNEAADGDGTGGGHSQGIIKATGTDNALMIDVGPTGSLTNGGLIQGLGKAGLVIGNPNLQFGASAVINTGTIEAGAGSKVVLAHVNVTQTGATTTAVGTIRTTGTGAELDLQDLTITNGTLSLAASSTLVATGTDTLTGVTLAGAGPLNVAAGASLALKGGTASLAGLNVAGQLSFDSTLSLQGSAAASVTGFLTSTSGASLTNVDDALSGSGFINVGTLSNQSGGTISGTGTPLGLGAAKTLSNAGKIDNATLYAPSVVNSGTMSNVVVNASTVTNNGTILNARFNVPFGNNVVNGKTGVITNGEFGDTTVSGEGLIQADGAGQKVLLAGTNVSLGRLSTSNGGVIEVASSTKSQTILSPEAIASGTQFVFDDGASANLSNTFFGTTMALDGVSIAVDGAGKTTNVAMDGFALQGGGRITLSDSANNTVDLTGFINKDGVISGAGQIEEIGLNNQAGGTILADELNPLTLTGANLTNDGTLEADGSTLRIAMLQSQSIQGGGKVLVTDGGTVDLSGAASFLGSFVYAGAGSIVGPVTVPAGMISGFATGDEFVFGKKGTFDTPLTTSWQENVQGTGGTLTIKASPTQTYATLQFAGVYDDSDFAASQVTLADGTHVAVTFTGTLRWASAVSGNWQTATDWDPTRLYVPGENDDALIAVGGAAYTVTVDQDTTVKSLATGTSATVDVKDGTLSVTTGTASMANAGTIEVEAGAAFATGGTFQQASTGRIAAVGLDAVIDIDKGGTISGGQISTGTGAVLEAAGTSAGLKNVAIGNGGSILVDNGTTLTMTNDQVTGTGEIDVALGSTLALVGGTISGNTIGLVGTLQIGASTTLTAPIDLSNGVITSGGVPVVAHNAGAIDGAGSITGAGLTLVNDGTIAAAPGGGSNSLVIGTGANTFTNNGDMSAGAGAALSFTTALNNAKTIRAAGGTVLFGGQAANSGSISAIGGTSVLRVGGTLTSTGSVSASGGGQIGLDKGGTIAGGQIGIDIGAVLAAANTSASLKNATIGNDGSILVDNGTTLTMSNDTVTGTGEIDVALGSTLALAGGTISGNAIELAGTLEIDTDTTLAAPIDLSNGVITSGGAPAAFHNAGAIDGAGAITGTGLTLINDGTITAASAGGSKSLVIDTGANTITNNGDMSAGTRAVLSFTSALNNAKTIRAAGGTVLFGNVVTNKGGISTTGLLSDVVVGLGGLIDNTGIVSASDGGLISLEDGGTISGGQISIGAGSALLAADGTPGSLKNAAVGNGGLIAITNDTTLTMTNDQVTGNGEIDVVLGSTLALAGGTISGNTIVLPGTLEIDADTTLTAPINLSNGDVVSGDMPAVFHNAGAIKGTGAITGAGLTLVNDGTITAAPAGGSNSLVIGTGANTYTNNGDIVALTGTEVTIGSALNNAKTIRASGGTILVTNQVTNTGEISATGATAALRIGPFTQLASGGGRISNTGSVSASNGALIDILGRVTQKVGGAGEVLATGAGTIVNMEDGSSIFGGQVNLTDNADLKIASGGVASLGSLNLSLDADSRLDVAGTTLSLTDDQVDSAGLTTVTGASSRLALRGTTLHGGTYLVQEATVQVSRQNVVLDDATLQLESGARVVSDGQAATLTNSGVIQGNDIVIGGGNLTLHNEGTVAPLSAKDSISIDTGSNAVINDGTLTAAAAGALLSIVSTLRNTATGVVSAAAGGLVQIKGALGNSGRVVASTGGTVIFDDGVDNQQGGQLTASNSGMMQVFGAATGGIANITGSDAVMDLEGSASDKTTANAVFASGAAGELMLDNSSHYAGVVSGFAKGDSIDVTDVAYVAGRDFYDPDTGTLNLSDGTHTARIQLLGVYGAGEFTFGSDNTHGTLVTFNAGAGGTPVGVDYSDATGGVYVDLAAQVTEFAPAGQGWSGGPGSVTPVSTDQLSGIQNVTGSAFDDLLVGGPFDSTLAGGAGNDLIYGNTSQTTADNASRLVLDGGSGDNALYGSSAYNTFMAGDAAGGFNQIWGAASQMAGVTGFTNNTLSFAETPQGESAYVDLLTGHNAYVNSDSQNNGIYTLEDAIANVPNVIGSSGGDVILADDGVDRITGAGGADQLYAGSGAGSQDTFAYSAWSDSNLVSGYDAIYGFNSGTDKIDLSALASSASHLLIQTSGTSNSVYLEATPGNFNANTDLAMVVNTTTPGGLKTSDFIF